jgi:hypothetical protein
MIVTCLKVYFELIEVRAEEFDIELFKKKKDFDIYTIHLLKQSYWHMFLIKLRVNFVSYLSYTVLRNRGEALMGSIR